MDIESSPEMAEQLKLESLPFVVAFHQGKAVSGWAVGKARGLGGGRFEGSRGGRGGAKLRGKRQIGFHAFSVTCSWKTP